MSDDSDRREPSPASYDDVSSSYGDEVSRVAVAAHSLIGGISAVRSALNLAMEQRQEPHVAGVLALAARRLDRMADELRDLALGLPGDPDTVDLREGSPFPRDLRKGTRVEVHSAFNDTWAEGFEIVEPVIGGYRVRRASDHSLLPGFVASCDVRVVNHPSSS